MLKLNVKFIPIIFLLFILNSTTCLADNAIELRQRKGELVARKEQLVKRQKELNENIQNLVKDIQNLRKSNTTESKRLAELNDNLLRTLISQNDFLISEIVHLNKEIDYIDKRVRTLEEKEYYKWTPPSPKPTSIYFTGKDRVWHWHDSFDFATITIGPRVRIHAQPNINVPNAPYNPAWTEHENIEISVFDVKPGPGSTRGWGLLQSYRHTRNGWVNLDDATILWCIKPYNKEAVRYWHWQNGVETPEENAYCVDPRH